MSQPFHVIVQGRAAGVSQGDESMDIDGRVVRPLIVGPSQRAAPLGATFDEALDALSAFPLMFIEPDGAFVWRTGRANDRLEGVLYDRGDFLSHVELKGICDAAALARFLDALGRQQTPLMFQLVRQAVFLDEASFVQSYCNRDR